METLLTPSARARENLRPYGVPLVISKHDIPPWAYYLKTISGAPIRFLLTLFLLLPFVSGEGAQVGVGLISALTFVYILADRQSKRKEFTWFRTGFDIPLILLFFTLIFWLIRSDSVAEYRIHFMILNFLLGIYFVAYAFDLFPGINRVYRIGVLLAGLSAALLLATQWLGQLVAQAPPDIQLFFKEQVPQLLTDRVNLLIALFFPWVVTGLLLTRKTVSKRLYGFLVGAGILMTLQMLIGGQPEVVFAGAVTVVLILYYIRRWLSLFITVLALGGAFLFNTPVRTTWETMNTDQRRNELKEDLKLFSDRPWFGVGLNTYDQERQKLGESTDLMASHNNYFQTLAVWGLWGLGLYMFTILSALTFTQRLWNDIARTHVWHRVIVLGLLGSQINLHLLGLFHWTWMDPALLAYFGFILGMVAYIGEGYGRGLVSDDHCL